MRGWFLCSSLHPKNTLFFKATECGERGEVQGVALAIDEGPAFDALAEPELLVLVADDRFCLSEGVVGSLLVRESFEKDADIVDKRIGRGGSLFVWEGMGQ